MKDLIEDVNVAFERMRLSAIKWSGAKSADGSWKLKWKGNIDDKNWILTQP